MPFNRLFKPAGRNRETTPPPPQDPAAAQPGPDAAATPPEPGADSAAFAAPETGDKVYLERDNRAVRIQRLDQALEFWNDYEHARPGWPYLRYAFDTRLQALEALESVSCIHPARDTGFLICTEPLVFGCYCMPDGSYEVLLAGEQMTPRTWSEAAEKFQAHHGRYRSQQRPGGSEKSARPASASQSVVFVKDYYQMDLSRTRYYRCYEAAGKEAARAFLWRRENTINHPDHAIVVETPDGTFYRDIDGIHEETGNDRGT